MKINWGTSIVIAFALFITFILYFVFKVQTNSKYDNELVVEEYYKHDAHFDDEMVEVQNAHDLAQKTIIDVSGKGVNITFPNDVVWGKIKGKVLLYRPSNKKMDFEVPIKLSNSSLLVPKSKFVAGRWDVILEWEYEGKKYLEKEVIYFQ